MKKTHKLIGATCAGLMALGSAGALGAALNDQGNKTNSSRREPSVTISASPSPSPVEVTPPPVIEAPPPPPPVAPPPPPVQPPKPKAVRTVRPPAPAPAPPVVRAAPAPVPPPPPPPPPAPVQAATPPPPPPPPAPAPITPRTLYEGSGNTGRTTEKFTTQGADWDLAWSYDCSNLGPGEKSNFIVWIDDADDQPGYNSGLNELGTGGSGLNHYHYGGTYWFTITTNCNWTLKATG